MRALPPLNSLRAFEAVARLGSIKAAAEDLAVTPQAVSQQIKVLEDWLEKAVVEAAGQGIRLTKEGEKLEPFVASGFAEFNAGVRALTNDGAASQIAINATPYFAARFLIPTLPDFRERNPDLEISLTTRLELPNFQADDVDLAIQWGYGDWNKLDANLLFHDHKVICCAPSLLEGKEVKTEADLLKLPLLTTTVSERLWRDVLAFLGLKEDEAKKSDAFDDAATMRQATQAGMGIGLISQEDAVEDIERGVLVAPLGIDALSTIPLDKVPAFYLLRSLSRKPSPEAITFVEWLVNLKQ